MFLFLLAGSEVTCKLGDVIRIKMTTLSFKLREVETVDENLLLEVFIPKRK